MALGSDGGSALLIGLMPLERSQEAPWPLPHEAGVRTMDKEVLCLDIPSLQNWEECITPFYKPPCLYCSITASWKGTNGAQVKGNSSSWRPLSGLQVERFMVTMGVLSKSSTE